MFHVDNSTGVPVMPQPSPVTSETELFFTEGGNGVPPTYPGPDWFNVIQSELLNILKAAGIDPDKMDNTQILVALKKLFLSRSNPFGDIKADGAAAIAAALTNLRLGEAAKRNVGTGANQIPDMSSWTFGVGLIDTPLVKFRFGSVSGAGAKTFSTPFPTEASILVFGAVQSSSGEVVLYSPQTKFGTLTKSGFEFINQAYTGSGSIVSSSNSVHYLAIGR